MNNSWSFEQLGTTAYGYLTVVNAAYVRQTGLTIDDFTVAVYNPAGVDITSSVSVTVTEFEVAGSPTGAYRFAIPFPPDAVEGAHTPIITDPLGRVHTCTFLTYATLYGKSGDGTPQMELIIRDTDGSLPASVAIGELTVRIYNPDREEVAASVSPTLTELEDGHFILGFDIGDGDEGDWFIDVIDAVRFPEGQQGVWEYNADAAAPIYEYLMQPEEALRRILLADSDVTDLISERVYPSQARFRSIYPLVLYTRTDSEYFETLHGLAGGGLAHASIQLDIFGRGYTAARATAKAVRIVLNAYAGVVAGDNDDSLTISRIRLVTKRDGFENPTDGRTTGIYRIIQEYDLWFSDS